MRPRTYAYLGAAGLAGLAGFALTGIGAGPVPVPPATAGAASGPLTFHAEARLVPVFAFTDTDGQPVTLDAFRDRVVLLNVWATWCLPCREEMPALDRLQAQLGGPDFAVVALSIDAQGRAAVEPFLADLGLENLAIYLDGHGAAMRDLALAGLPTTLLIDREGFERARLVGPAEWDSLEMVDTIRRLITTTGPTDGA